MLDVCESPNTSEQTMNPFALLDQLYAHVLQSTQDLENVLSLLGTIFYLEENQKLTLAFLESFLGLNLEEVVLLFWDFHSIIHIPSSKTNPIHFYHTSFRDYLVDHHGSGDLHINQHAAHSCLLKSCMLQLSKDPSFWSPGNPVLAYSRKSRSHHYSHGNSIKARSLDGVLESVKPLYSFSLLHPTAVECLANWWKIYAGALKFWHSVVICQSSEMYLLEIHVFCSAILNAARHHAADLLQFLTDIYSPDLRKFHGPIQESLWCGLYLHFEITPWN